MESNENVLCFLCGKQLDCLSDSERQKHVNTCLDSSSSSKENVNAGAKDGNIVNSLPDFSQFRCGEMNICANEVLKDCSKLSKKKTIKIPVDGQAAKAPPVSRKPRAPKTSICKSVGILNKVNVEFNKLSLPNKFEFLKVQLPILHPTMDEMSKFISSLYDCGIAGSTSIKAIDSQLDVVELDATTLVPSESTIINTKQTDTRTISLANLSTMRLELGEVISKEVELRAKEKRLRANIKKAQRIFQSSTNFQLEGAETDPVTTALEYLFPTACIFGVNSQLEGDVSVEEDLQSTALKRPLWLISTQYGEDFERSLAKRRISEVRDAVLYSDNRYCEPAVDVIVDSSAGRENFVQYEASDCEVSDVTSEKKPGVKLPEPGVMSLFSQLIGELDENDCKVDESQGNDSISTVDDVYHRFKGLVESSLYSFNSIGNSFLDASNLYTSKLFVNTPPPLQATLSLLLTQITDEKLLFGLLNGSSIDVGEDSLTEKLIEFFTQLPLQLSWSAVLPLVLLSLLLQHNNTNNNVRDPHSFLNKPETRTATFTHIKDAINTVTASTSPKSLAALPHSHATAIEVVSLLSPSPIRVIRSEFPEACIDDDDDKVVVGGTDSDAKDFQCRLTHPPVIAHNVPSTATTLWNGGEVIVLCDDSPPQVHYSPSNRHVEEVVNENDYYWDYSMEGDVYSSSSSHAVDVYSFDGVDDRKDYDVGHSHHSPYSDGNEVDWTKRDSASREAACLEAENEPLFDSMSMSELQEHCKKYGLKTESRVKMVNILRALWQRMHRTSSLGKGNPTQALSQARGLLPMLTQEGLFEYIQKHDTLYERVLLYHPIELDPLLVELKLHYEKVTKVKVLQMLDSMKVFISMSSSSGRQNKK